MKVDHLDPGPDSCEPFRADRQKHVPARTGCYLLTTFNRHILYVGRTNNLWRRMGEHLDDRRKTQPTREGRVILFHWLEYEDTDRLERTWMNACVVEDGRRPLLNLVDASMPGL